MGTVFVDEWIGLTLSHQGEGSIIKEYSVKPDDYKKAV